MHEFTPGDITPFEDNLDQEQRWSILIGCLELMTSQDLAIGFDFEEARLRAKVRCLRPHPKDVYALDARLLTLSLQENPVLQ